ncbi:hypothetical protein [Glutamicibacter sp. Je.9.36]|uniref:hypothetical protein n=1 Tax=Glutamicibacter sp. Je.9.36 TaxID=3142837 RepID=UPI003DA7DEC7
MTELNPAEFDFEAWIDDARLPEDSGTVFKRGDLVAKINHLARQIRVESDAQAGEKTSASPLITKLMKEREELMKAFARSEVTFYLRALPQSKIKELVDQHPLADDASRDDQLAQRVALNRALLAESIVALESPTLEKRDIKMTIPLVATLEAKLGAAQLSKLLTKRQQVQSEAPAPDADFLPDASGTSQDSGQ